MLELTGLIVISFYAEGASGESVSCWQGNVLSQLSLFISFSLAFVFEIYVYSTWATYHQRLLVNLVLRILKYHSVANIPLGK